MAQTTAVIEGDTIKMLRECDAGVKMGTATLDDVMKYVKTQALYDIISKSKENHNQLESEIESLLSQYHDDGKSPNPMAKGMSWMKTNVMLKMNESDGVIADLITDGCNMGIKSLRKYLNQYKAADEKSKTIAKHLIKLEQDLVEEISVFL